MLHQARSLLTSSVLCMMTWHLASSYSKLVIAEEFNAHKDGIANDTEQFLKTIVTPKLMVLVKRNIRPLYGE